MSPTYNNIDFLGSQMPLIQHGNLDKMVQLYRQTELQLQNTIQRLQQELESYHNCRGEVLSINQSFSPSCIGNRNPVMETQLGSHAHIKQFH
jgi:hypothetical protein